MFTVLLVTALSPAAPLPSPRPPREIRASDLVGSWKLTWSGTSFTARFDPDGGYTCCLGQSTWKGSWRLEGGVLTVCEHLDGNGANSYSGTCPSFLWNVRLCRAGGGRLKASPHTHSPSARVEFSRQGEQRARLVSQQGDDLKYTLAGR